MKEKIILIVGKSGSGKTTITERCVSDYGLKSIQSYTTRSKRTEDEKGHIFVTKEEFDKLKNLVAYTMYNGNEYCATAEQVDNNDLYVIDPNGVQYFKNNYHGKKEVVVVYIVADEDPHKAFNSLYERMRARGDSAETAAIRVALDNHEFKGFEKSADYVFINNTEKDIERICNALAFLVREGELDE